MFGKSVGVMAIVVLMAAPTFAQSTQELPRHSVSAGVRWAYPTYDGSRDGTPGIDASYRGWLTPHIGLEVNGGRWGDTNAFDSRAPIRTFTEKVTNSTFGANVIGRIPAGRVSFIAGGGPAYFTQVQTNEVRIRDQWTERTNTIGTFGAQMVLEADVRLTRHVSAFASVRGELRDISYGTESAVAYPAVGLRFAF